jgi:hypothetical protein
MIALNGADNLLVSVKDWSRPLMSQSGPSPGIANGIPFLLGAHLTVPTYETG